MAVVGPIELRRMVHGDADLAFIESQAAKLVPLGVPRGHVESATYNAHFYFSKQFASLLRIFKQYNDDDAKLQRVLKLGIDKKYFETITGRDRSRRKLSMHERLLKRGAGNFSAQQMGYIAMFNAQRDDMLNRVRDVRRHHDGIIAELERQLRVAEARKDEELEAIRLEFLPAGTFVEQPNYNNSSDTLVKNQRVLDHLMVGENSMHLAEYVHGRVEELELVKEERAAKRFRGLLSSVGVEYIPEAAARVDEVADEDQAETNPIHEDGARAVSQGSPER